MDASTEDPLGFTPADLVRLGRSLGVHCPTCRALRDPDLAQLAAARPGQRIVEIAFRCRKCGSLGTPLLTWRGEANAPRSFDYARAMAAHVAPPKRKTPPG